MERAEWVLARCREFRCLPSQLLAESTELMRLMSIVNAGGGSGLE